MQQTFLSILSGIPLPALIIGMDDRMLAMNAGAEALLGGAAKGRHHALSLRQPEIQATIAAAISQGKPGVARHVITGPGPDVVYRVTVTPLAEGLGVLCVFEDLTAEEQMGQMRREFVANVSHELRSPLTALLGFIETLRGAAKDDPVARDRFLAVMEREAGRMNRLIHDLLHLSRVEAEERVRPTQRVNLLDLLRSTVVTLRPLSEAAKVAVTIEGEDTPHVLPGDPDQLVQVFQNLIENAIKYGGAGGAVTIRLSLAQLPKAAALRVDVIDRGEGIDPVHIPRLTERFYRVDGHRSREKGGTGLGLAIVKHIVQRHRGRLAIASAPGQGSSFSVILPLD
ncbi:ATP-binding protein [Pseudotabrizicola sp. L79]|uniref:ATP-binding protein n=1 Tax=Pseudotabrizicola sp. L79 TaxID=3118402 RepID=UPI002F95BAF0